VISSLQPAGRPLPRPARPWSPNLPAVRGRSTALFSTGPLRPLGPPTCRIPAVFAGARRQRVQASTTTSPSAAPATRRPNLDQVMVPPADQRGIAGWLYDCDLQPAAGRPAVRPPPARSVLQRDPPVSDPGWPPNAFGCKPAGSGSSCGGAWRQMIRRLLLLAGRRPAGGPVLCAGSAAFPQTWSSLRFRPRTVADAGGCSPQLRADLAAAYCW